MPANWYFSQNKQRLGPFSWNQLRQMAAFNLLQRADHVWEEGTAKWREACTVEGLFPKQEGPRTYHLSISGQTVGPYSADQLRMLLLAGRIAPDILACAEGASSWTPLGQLPEFASYVPAPSESHAVLLRDRDLGISKEEAELHLAGKKGDVVARLLSRLMDLKRRYSDNPSLVETLDRSIEQLKAVRASTPPGESALR